MKKKIRVIEQLKKWHEEKNRMKDNYRYLFEGVGGQVM